MSHPKRPLPHLDTREDYVDGWRMFTRYCTTAGADKPPIVLVHGLSMSSRYMIPTARRLARAYRVYAPDLPGYGESEKPRKTLTIAQLADVLRDWMDHLGIDKAILLGNSMGCQVVVSFGVNHPERVTGAILVGPTIDPTAVHLPKLFARAVANMLFEPLTFYPVLVHDYLHAGVGETFQALEDAIQYPVEQKLRRLRAPTLVVRGEHDQLVTQGWAQHVTRLLPNSELRIAPGGAHVVNFDKPGWLVERVEEFLKSF